LPIKASDELANRTNEEVDELANRTNEEVDELASQIIQERSMSTTPPALDMRTILTDTSNRVIVCCGAGGVGKTTTAAAMALRAAEYGRTVVVLTIDPARRLAQALGIKDLGNTPQRVPLAPEVSGELHAMMLDMRRTFDEMVIQYSGPERADAILDNQFYQTVATSLAGTQEYMAMEKLGQLLAQDKWDLIVVDTPPSRNALDFLDAPKRLGSFMDSRLWRLLLAPGRGIGRLVTGAVGLAMKALSTVLGSQMLSDAAAFVQSLDATFGGFREKADRTYELLKRRGTQFVVVSAAEPDALREASFFVDRLSQEHMPFAGLILNRTHPTLSDLHAEKADESAEELEKKDPDALAAAVLRIHADRAMTAKREIRLLSRFTGANPHVPIVGVPSLPFDVSDLEALRAIADQITGEASAA
jgi:anion-transporting  ArsA/GET3 family ATPase